MSQIKKKQEGYYRFGAKVDAKAAECLDKSIFKELFYNFSCTASTLDIQASSNLSFTIGEAESLALGNYEFAIRVTERGVSVVGRDERSLIHGYYSLIEMIEPVCLDEGCEELAIPCIELLDAPDTKLRMVHYCLFPENELWEMERFIRYVALLKCTHVVVEFWGTLKFDALPELGWHNAYTKEQLKPIMQLARDMGVEIVPMFNHWGHASQSRGRIGKHTVLDQNPRLATLFNFTGWVWRTESERVQRIHAQVRRELMELCGEGSFFHIGCDEAYIPVSHEPIVDVVKYIGDVASDLATYGRKTIMWGDMLLNKKHFPKEARYEANVTNDKIEEIMLTGIPKSVIIADWQYNAAEHPFKTSEHLKNNGFSVLVCPYDENYANGACAVKTVRELELEGIIHTTWHTLYRGIRPMSLVLNRAWNNDFEWSDDAIMYVAALFAKVYPANGDYSRAGWSKHQIALGFN